MNYEKNNKGKSCPQEWVGKDIVVMLNMPIPVAASAIVGAEAAEPQIGFPEMSGKLLLDLEDAIVFATTGAPTGFSLGKHRVHAVYLKDDGAAGGQLIT